MVERLSKRIHMFSKFPLVSQCLIGLLLVGVGTGQAFQRKEVLEQMRERRPANLEVLVERPTGRGDYILGIYSVSTDQVDASMRRYKIWQEWPDDLQIRTESVSCDVNQPIRVTREANRLLVRHLNPGGLITDGNREDHLIWWAACVPDQAGVDPATLKKKALSLGYSTLLVESEEVLPGSSR